MRISLTVFMLLSGHDFVTDRQTDDHAENNMSPDPEVGRHKTKSLNTKTYLYNETIHLTSSTFMHAISDYQVQVQMVYCNLGHQPITHETMTNIQ